MKVKVEVETRAVVELELPDSMENEMMDCEFDNAENYIRNNYTDTLKGALVKEINKTNICWEIL
jgi:hypothetical protein